MRVRSLFGGLSSSALRQLQQRSVLGPGSDIERDGKVSALSGEGIDKVSNLAKTHTTLNEAAPLRWDGEDEEEDYSDGGDVGRTFRFFLPIKLTHATLLLSDERRDESPSEPASDSGEMSSSLN